MTRQHLFLILSVVGFLLPNYFVAQESLESGNIMLWARPGETLEQMFINRVTTVFTLDLLWVVMVFLIWTYFDARKRGVKEVYAIWIMTFLLGISGTFPLYLYLRNRKPTS